MFYRVKVWWKMRQIEKVMRQAVRALESLDLIFQQEGMPRQGRRAFWREFVNEGAVREDTVQWIAERVKKGWK